MKEVATVLWWALRHPSIAYSWLVKAWIIEHSFVVLVQQRLAENPYLYDEPSCQQSVDKSSMN